jgi:hypothetical protein
MSERLVANCYDWELRSSAVSTLKCIDVEEPDFYDGHPHPCHQQLRPHDHMHLTVNS